MRWQSLVTEIIFKHKKGKPKLWRGHFSRLNVKEPTRTDSGKGIQQKAGKRCWKRDALREESVLLHPTNKTLSDHLVTTRRKDTWISSGKEISSLFKTGYRWHCSSFTIIYSGNSRQHDRSAILVSRSNGNAVQRNKMKRVWREILYKQSSSPPYFDILIKPAGSQLPSAEELKSCYCTWKKSVKK
jgi:ribonuclease P protein component